MSLTQLTIEGEDFIGLLGLSTDKYALLSPKFPQTDVLGVPEIKSLIYGTHLVGMFCVGNSNGIILPFFTPENELDVLKKHFDELGVSVGVSTGKHTSHGVLIACNDKAAVVSPLIENHAEIKDILDVEVVSMDIAGHIETGSCITATNKGFLIHPEASDLLSDLSEIFGVDGGVGTVNYGIPYPSTGLIANSNGAISGGKTTGIEMGRMDRSLGFL